MASAPDDGVSSEVRKMAAGRKLTGIAIEKEILGRTIARIRAR